jgi:hypothetical protein
MSELKLRRGIEAKAGDKKDKCRKNGMFNDTAGSGYKH